MKSASLLLLTITCAIIFEGCSKENSIKPAKQNQALIKQTNAVTAFSVAKLLGNNMVVQRDKPFVVWGQAVAGHSITVKVSWNSTTFTATSSATGDWEVVIPSAAATTVAQNIVATDNGGPTTTLNNILIGDVWVCSGQSNMTFPMDSLGPWPGSFGVTNYKAEIAAANYPNIRLTNVPYLRPTAPVDYVNGAATWTVCSPQTAGKYSALAYYFGRKLNATLNVPVGLVVSALAATSCQEWINFDIIKNYPIYAGTTNASKLYNGMIYPLRKLAIKGFIWDQGEANRFDPPSYYTYLNSAMIKNWRTIFNQGNLPFYYIQMTPYAAYFFQTTPWGDDPTATDYALFREYQRGVRTQTPNTGMAVMMDVNEITDIHWKAKKSGGERLAALALNQTYGMSSVQCLGPQFLNVQLNGNKGIVNFVPGTANGLTTIDGKALKQYFFIAGRDSVFRQAIAVIKGNSIELSPPAGLPLPVLSLRYAFTNFPVTNLQNSAGLPAEPFRTDKWSK